MNLPNSLTIARVVMVPIFIAAYYLDHFILAMLIFIIAALTDLLDGKIARKKNWVSDFGKFWSYAKGIAPIYAVGFPLSSRRVTICEA